MILFFVYNSLILIFCFINWPISFNFWFAISNLLSSFFPEVISYMVLNSNKFLTLFIFSAKGVNSL